MLVVSGLLLPLIQKVENNIHNPSNLVKKQIMIQKYQTLRLNIFTTSDYDKFTSETLERKTKEKGIVDKSNISNLVKKSDLNTKLATLTTKVVLESEQDKIPKRQVFDSGYFCGNSHIKDDGMQNYLVFQLVYKHSKTIANSNKFKTWRSRGLSNDS